MAHQNKEHSYKFIDTPLAAILISLLIIAAFNYASIEWVAEKYLDLTSTDLMMIPVGALMFWLFWNLMHHGFIKKYLIFFEQRESATSGARGAADSLTKEAREIESKIQAELNSVRQKAIAEKEIISRGAEKEAEDLKHAAEEQGVRILKDTKQKISLSRDKLRSEMQEEGKVLVDQILNKIRNPEKGQIL